MMRTAALELAPFGVRVNAVVPAVVDTPMSGAGLASRPDPEAARQALIARHPLGRFATPEEIAAAVHFLATEATFSTGSEMYVDGGWMIN
jgi:NAD(P)-dependent dehydrogenase (short-subunit alcohol dehydrogenase family)